MPNPDDDDVETNPMQKALRESGARPDESLRGEAYKTNRGTVVLSTPQDQRRMAIMERARGEAVLRPRWKDGDYSPIHHGAMADPELDIDWGIHKMPVERPVEGALEGARQEETLTVYHGRARGGPYNTMSVVHHQVVYRIAIDADNHLKSMPGQVASTTDRPCLFGSYVFNEPVKEWVWDESSVSETA